MRYDMVSSFAADGTAQIMIGHDRYKVDRTGRIIEAIPATVDE